MRRGISGGQKRRLTTGEMIVGPIKALFMDEISNGLDSSTTFQIVSCLRQFVHISDATALISLLQPAPETFNLFDDVVLMSEGKVIYHGPQANICKFFRDCGFQCPERKGVADFLQEVISRKDQAQYWKRDEPYSYVTVDQFIERFRRSDLGLLLEEELAEPFDKRLSHKDALSFKKYSLTKWKMLKACSRREFILMKRNSFVYIFKSVLLVSVALVAMTVFLQTGRRTDVVHANHLMGSLFYGLFILLADGLPELTLTLSRLAVFRKQKELHFYPAWAFAVPSALLKIPISLLEAFFWTSLTYYVIGYSPEIGRFFRQFLIFFAVHLSSTSMFRAIASVFRTFVATTTIGTLSMLLLPLFSGFIIRKSSMPAWLQWGFWVSPLTYGEIGLTANEFHSPRWGKVISGLNKTVGQKVLEDRGLDFDSYFYWVALVALLCFTLFFNLVFALALTFLKSPGRSRAIISNQKSSIVKTKQVASRGPKAKSGRMILPFEPLAVTFQDVQYYVDTPSAMRKKGFPHKKLQLLSDITGAFRPGVLTALMGVSGAGKTTLLDVLSGRKTGGAIEGEIRIGGYLKVQETFARVSGYCEQFDVHSPHITVRESVMYSAWLRLPSHIDPKAKTEIVNEVLETIELDEIKDSLVGIAGVNGLSTEQRKRLTIAVELVAGPSIIFMDEPTSGLDARAAAIVMRAVKNVVKTGRTVVCTIHQPSIDIFEAFDELILMKAGGRIIYYGPLGQHSHKVIEYFESIPGVPKIQHNHNPATWMLEVTSKSAEVELDVDFAEIYKASTLYEDNKNLVKQLSSPSPDWKDLQFPSRFPQPGFKQFKACLWKQHWSYWRSPSYNLTRFAFVSITSALVGLLFWQKAKDLKTQQDLFNIFGAMYASVLFVGINNCSTVLFHVTMERNVFYRERFSGMYSSWAYSFAQVVIEIPYSFVQSVIYVVITYPMIGYYWSVQKVLWLFYSMFCSLLIFNYLGMLLVAVTPNIHVAFTLRSCFYATVNLFSGYIMPKPNIPRWWIWMYYLSPTSWVLNGLLTSQYGDIEKEISAFEETKSVSDFLKDYFGYKNDFLGVVALMLIIFPIVFASLFAFFIGTLNFQKR